MGTGLVQSTPRLEGSTGRYVAERWHAREDRVTSGILANSIWILAVSRGSMHTMATRGWLEAPGPAAGFIDLAGQQTGTRETRGFASEVKFLVTPDIGAGIREWARARLAPDAYAAGAFGDEYRTTSVYFDTDRFDVFHRRGSFGRSKYRIRRYGEAAIVFLERKLRNSTLLTKRRTPVALEALRHLEVAEDAPEWSGRWFHQRLQARRLRPISRVSYDRMARVGETPYGPLRLTLDEALRAEPASGVAFGNGDGVPFLERGLVLELKFRVQMPALFKQLVEEFGLRPQTVSKYRLAAAALGYVTDPPPADAADSREAAPDA